MEMCVFANKSGNDISFEYVVAKEVVQCLSFRVLFLCAKSVCFSKINIFKNKSGIASALDWFWSMHLLVYLQLHSFPLFAHILRSVAFFAWWHLVLLSLHNSNSSLLWDYNSFRCLKWNKNAWFFMMESEKEWD